MLSINDGNLLAAAYTTPKSIKRRSSAFEYTSKAIEEKKVLLKNRLRDMKSRIMKRNKKFHENDSVVTSEGLKVLYSDITELKNTPSATIKRRKTSYNSSNASSGIIGDAFECTKNFLSSTIIDQPQQIEDAVCEPTGLTAMNNERNLARLKKTLRKLRKRNQHKRITMGMLELDSRRACGCAGGEIFTSTSTNLRSLCHSTLNENEKAFFLNSQQHLQPTNDIDSVKYFNLNINNFYNYTKTMNLYNDLNKSASGNLMDEAIVLDRFNNIGEFKVWYV